VEQALVEQAQRGDADAFEALALTAGPRLHRVAYRMLRDSDLAHDVTQQALIAIWRELPSLRDPKKFQAWTYRLLVRFAYEAIRSRRRAVTNIQVLPGWTTGGREPATPANSLTVEDRDALERAFRHISIEQRAVVVMRHYVGMSLAEIGATLGIPEGTAASRLHYAMRSLRAALEADLRPVAAEDRTA
jgi:RNA polymerase sigma-70 factor, ECF subfamily